MTHCWPPPAAAHPNSRKGRHRAPVDPRPRQRIATLGLAVTAGVAVLGATLGAEPSVPTVQAVSPTQTMPGQVRLLPGVPTVAVQAMDMQIQPTTPTPAPSDGQVPVLQWADIVATARAAATSASSPPTTMTVPTPTKPPVVIVPTPTEPTVTTTPVPVSTPTPVTTEPPATTTTAPIGTCHPAT